MDFRPVKDDTSSDPWTRHETEPAYLRPINLAPLKGIIESDPVRSRVLKVLIEDGSWVSTGDLLRAARQEKPIVGAVTVGTMLHGLNNLVSSKLILSRTSLNSGIEWAEWRINPDWIRPTRKLLQMLRRPKFEKAVAKKRPSKRQTLLDKHEEPTTHE